MERIIIRVAKPVVGRPRKGDRIDGMSRPGDGDDGRLAMVIVASLREPGQIWKSSKRDVVNYPKPPYGRGLSSGPVDGSGSVDFVGRRCTRKVESQ